MFYYLYQITNLVNGKIYVGVHKTRDMNDGYMGSGKVINRAIAKHGLENFTKVILEQFADVTAMYAREKEVVTDEFLLREDTYNIMRGGHGGFDYINKNKDSAYLETRRQNGKNNPPPRQSFFGEENPGFGKKSSSNFSMNEKVRIKAAHRASTKEAIKKKKETWIKTGRGRGEKNSQFGKMWITNETESRAVRKTEAIPPGWRKGRKIINKQIGEIL